MAIQPFVRESINFYVIDLTWSHEVCIMFSSSLSFLGNVACSEFTHTFLLFQIVLIPRISFGIM